MFAFALSLVCFFLLNTENFVLSNSEHGLQAKLYLWPQYRDFIIQTLLNKQYCSKITLENGYCDQMYSVSWENSLCKITCGAVTMIDRRLKDYVLLLEDTLLKHNVKGDIVECGTWQGGASIAAQKLLQFFDLTETSDIVLVDSFSGHPDYRMTATKDFDMLPYVGSKYLTASIESVKDNFENFLASGPNVMYIKGYFNDTLPSYRKTRNDKTTIAVLRMDADSYTSTTSILENLFDYVVDGGLIVVDDYYDYESCRNAVHDFLNKQLKYKDVQLMATPSGFKYFYKTPDGKMTESC